MTVIVHKMHSLEEGALAALHALSSLLLYIETENYCSSDEAKAIALTSIRDLTRALGQHNHLFD